MNQNHPVRDGSDILITFGREATGELIDVVVDVDENADVLGIEVLGLFARHPGLTIAHETAGQLSVSIDSEADALYFRFARGRATDQLVRQAVVVFDAADGLQSIRVRVEE